MRGGDPESVRLLSPQALAVRLGRPAGRRAGRRGAEVLISAVGAAELPTPFVRLGDQQSAPVTRRVVCERRFSSAAGQLQGLRVLPLSKSDCGQLQGRVSLPDTVRVFAEQPLQDGSGLIVAARPQMDAPQEIQAIIGQKRLVVRDFAQPGRGGFPIFVLKRAIPRQECSAGFLTAASRARPSGPESEPAYRQAEAGETDRRTNRKRHGGGTGEA